MPPFNATISSHDGKSFGAYVARAAAPKAPCLVIIQEIFGVNAGMRQICDLWAREGYHTICPDIFWRQEPGIELTDKTEAEWQKAYGFFKGYDVALGLKDVQATLAYARQMEGSNGRAGTLGFCLGGKMAYLMAARSDADCNISYYGVGLDALLGEMPSIKKPLLMHIAGRDEYVPKDAQMKIRAAASAHPHIHVYVYEDADHAFARINGIHFDAAASALAEKRSSEFLAAHLR